ncbi:alpha/beta hydrolase [Paenibacillus sp. HB172176]|uniref:alpha/beta hydrolase n=1 Tax=Paenibacillus sp. HB172176 TaxID=2493690 RepID=UPI001439D3F7|nr:alpha/beta hydrolase [Paenibacillus sp. HB172176]
MKQLLWQENAPHALGNEEEDKPYLELFLLESKKPKSLVIVCPGGGYMGRSHHEGPIIAQWLNSIGVSAAVLHYRVHPYGYPVPMIDAQRAVRYARYFASEWNVDPDRIGLMGFSAGGHLAATVGTHHDQGIERSIDGVDRESCRPDALILCYPVISFQDEYTHVGSRAVQLGEDPDPELIEFLSNELHVKEDTPPTFLWHTAEDKAVVPENSLLFAMSLSKHRIPYELHIFEEGVHGIGLAEDVPDTAEWSRLAERWLIRLGWTSA